ncbi:hypothetical protein AMTRI_Chr06g190860 [Amborella trichopoda]
MNFSRANLISTKTGSGFLGFQIERKNWRRERCQASFLATLVFTPFHYLPRPLCHPSLVAPIHGSGFARPGLSFGSEIKLATITLTKLVKRFVGLASSWTLKAAQVREFSF